MQHTHDVSWNKYTVGTTFLDHDKIFTHRLQENTPYVLGVWHGTPFPEKITKIDTSRTSIESMHGRVFHTTSSRGDATFYTTDPSSDIVWREADPLCLYVRTENPFIFHTKSDGVVTATDLVDAIYDVVPVDYHNSISVRSRIEGRFSDRNTLPNADVVDLLSLVNPNSDIPLDDSDIHRKEHSTNDGNNELKNTLNAPGWPPLASHTYQGSGNLKTEVLLRLGYDTIIDNSFDPECRSKGKVHVLIPQSSANKVKCADNTTFDTSTDNIRI